MEINKKSIFISLVKSLKLKFPVAEIAQKTGYGKGQISEILNEANKKEPSRSFLITFCEKYELNFAQLFEHDVPETRINKDLQAKNDKANAQKDAPPEQISDNTKDNSPAPPLLEVLIRAESSRAEAERIRATTELERALSGRDIAATNKMLATMLNQSQQPIMPTDYVSKHVLQDELSKRDMLLEGTLKLIADLDGKTYEEIQAKAHIAGLGLVKSRKSGTRIDTNK